MISALSRRHRVTVVTTDDPDEYPAGLWNALSECHRVLSLPHRLPKQGSARFAAALARSWLGPMPVDLWKARVPAVMAEVRRLVGEGTVDLCVADFLAAAANVALGGPTPVAFFEQAVEDLFWERLAVCKGRRGRRG